MANKKSYFKIFTSFIVIGLLVTGCTATGKKKGTKGFKHNTPLIKTDEWTKLTDSLVEFNSIIWKAKKDAGISLAAPLSGQKVPEELTIISEALVSMHKLE